MRGLGIVICLLIALVCYVILSEIEYDCEEKGGQMVRQMNGMYDCLEVRKVGD